MKNNSLKLIKSKRYLVLFTFFIFSRVIFLDSDLPSFDIFNYQPIDEFWYNNAAFNLFRFGDIEHKILPYVESDSLPTNIFQNLLTFITLKTFGNNYFGLRMSSVIASLGIFGLFYLTLQNYISKSQQRDVWKSTISQFVVFGCAVYLAFDFPFLLASRVSEPTIFRMLSLAILMYFFSSSFAHKHIGLPWFTFASGFIAFSAVLYVYPSNAFLIPAIWGICIYANWNRSIKRLAFYTFLFVIGGIICILSYEYTLRLFYGKSYIDQLAVYTGFVERVNLPNSVNTTGPSFIKKSLTNIFGIVSTNIFRFNPILLITWLAALPIVIVNVYKKYLLNQAFLLLILIFFFIQLIFINDYYYRKLVFLLPLVLLTIASGLNLFLFSLQNRRAVFGYRIYLFVVSLFVVIVFFMNCVPKFIGKDVLLHQKYIIAFALIGQLGFLTFARKKLTLNLFSNFMLVLLIVPSLYFAGRYIFINPTFTYKKTMNDLSQYVNGKLMVGGMSTGFRLYNNYFSVIDGYGYKNTEEGKKKYAVLLDKILNEKGKKYSILYKSPGNSLFHAENIVYLGKIKLVMSLELDKNPIAPESIGLYEYITK